MRKALLGACLVIASFGTFSAQAASILVYKLGVGASGVGAVSDVVGAWQGTGGFNEGNSTAMSLLDSTLDYKNSFADTNWADVLSVDVGMYSGGAEVSHLVFSPGTGKSDFYSPSNLTSSNYTDLGSFNGNFFNEVGDSARKFFVNQNYGGCPADVGWFVIVISGGEGCGWESTRTGTNGRAFLYSLGNVRQNWTSGTVGSADVFAITVTTADSVPEPYTIILTGSALALLGFARRRRRP